MRYVKLNNVGDTIVEVLLAVTVLGMVIGGAYRSTNLSLRQTQQAQERAQASNYVEEQLEILKYKAADSTVTTANLQNTPYCFLFGTTFVRPAGMTVGDITSYDACKKGPDGRYKIAVSYSSATGTYQISAYWESLGDAGPENVTVHYRSTR